VSPPSLLEELRIDLSEVLRYDLYIGLAGGVLAGWLAWDEKHELGGVLSTASQLLGAVVGTAIAAFAIVTAFMDESFLRKVRMLGREPGYFVAPLAFTIAIGVVAAIAMIGLSALPATAPLLVRVALAAATGLFTIWTLASLLPNVKMLMQFLQVRFAASELRDVPPGGDDK